jgi:hypothetical protein
MAWFVLYLLGFALVWYENRFIVCDMLDRPLWFTPKNQTMLWIVRLLITYGSLAGIWYAYAWPQALVAFVVYYAFEKVTFRRSYNREFRERYSRYLKRLREDAVKEGELVDEQAMVTQASEFAHRTILRNMKGELT